MDLGLFERAMASENRDVSGVVGRSMADSSVGRRGSRVAWTRRKVQP